MIFVYIIYLYLFRCAVLTVYTVRCILSICQCRRHISQTALWFDCYIEAPSRRLLGICYIVMDKSPGTKNHWKFEVATPVQTRRQVTHSIIEIQGQSSFACVLSLYCFCCHIVERHPICSRCWRDSVQCWEHDMGTQDTVLQVSGGLFNSGCGDQIFPNLGIEVQ